MCWNSSAWNQNRLLHWRGHTRFITISSSALTCGARVLPPVKRPKSCLRCLRRYALVTSTILLKHRTYRDHVRCVLSLRPNQDLSTVLRTTKANSAGAFCKSQSVPAPLWARGYFARSLGRVHIGAVRRYLDEQAHHHGYARRVIPPVYRYCCAEPVRCYAPSRADITYVDVRCARSDTGAANRNPARAADDHRGDISGGGSFKLHLGSSRANEELRLGIGEQRHISLAAELQN